MLEENNLVVERIVSLSRARMVLVRFIPFSIGMTVRLTNTFPTTTFLTILWREKIMIPWVIGTVPRS